MSDIHIVFDYKTEYGKSGHFLVPVRLTHVTAYATIYEPLDDHCFAWSDLCYAVRVAQAKDEHWGQSRLMVTKHDENDEWFTRHEWSHASLDLHRFKLAGEIGIVQVQRLVILTPLGRINQSINKIKQSVKRICHISKRLASDVKA